MLYIIAITWLEIAGTSASFTAKTVEAIACLVAIASALAATAVLATVVVLAVHSLVLWTVFTLVKTWATLQLVVAIEVRIERCSAPISTR